MSDEITRLKAELVELNTKCQLARDNEVRFALQRSRLEAERTQLLVKLVEAVAPTATPTAAPAALIVLSCRCRRQRLTYCSHCRIRRHTP